MYYFWLYDLKLLRLLFQVDVIVKVGSDVKPLRFESF